MNFPPVKYETINFRGGLDQVTPTLSLPSGYARDSLNFECGQRGGYTRIGGYERFDGTASPSGAGYLVISINPWSVPALGSTITGFTSGATGVLVAQTATTFVLAKVVGNFVAPESLQVGGVTVSAFITTTGPNNAKNAAIYQAAAADAVRQLILKPPGSGPARGVFVLSDIVYAFRDNIGATSCDLWKATTSGWVQIPYVTEISFTAGGPLTPIDGQTLTQGGVTATIKRVILQNGAWAGSTAAGRFVITAVAGGNFAVGAATAGGIAVTLSGVQTAITQLAGGKYHADFGNFFGGVQTQRMYGCDGVNRGFEFDGFTFVPIATGAIPDTPKYSAVHKNALFFCITSSLFYSATGLPYNFSSISNGGQIAVGQIITGLLVQPGAQTTGAMAVYTQNSTLMLYGTGQSTWNLVAFNTGTGAIDYSVQNLSESYQFDSFGVIALSTTLNYGNFDQASLTAAIKPFVDANRANLTSSCLCRDKNQYRVFFSTGFGLYLTMVNSQYLGAMPVFFPVAGNGGSGVYNIWESVLSSGIEVIYMCGFDGYIYQMDKGTSFDGAAIPAYVTLNYDALRSPRILKRYRKAALEMQGSTYAEISFAYSLGYGNSSIQQPSSILYPNNFSPSFWDSFTWDSFTWDGSNLLPSELEMAGTAENVACTLGSNNNYTGQFTLNSIIIHYTPRRGMR